MHKLIPVAALATIIGLVCLPGWRHATHHRQAADLIAVAAVFAVLEVGAWVRRSVAKARKSPRSAVSSAAARR